MMNKFGHLEGIESQRIAVDYVWDNFQQYIFSDKRPDDIIYELRNELNKGKWFKKIFNYDLDLFLKAFREFRVQRAKIIDEQFDEYVYDLRCLWRATKDKRLYEILPSVRALYELLPSVIARNIRGGVNE